MLKNRTKGFTLIELLVVIAIIGVLAAIALPALNDARNKGSDTAIKANLANVRAQAEIFYDGNSAAYTGLCANSNVLSAITSMNSASGGNNSVCSAAAATWALSSKLKSSTGGGYWCVDSTGSSTPRAANIATDATSCL